MLARTQSVFAKSERSPSIVQQEVAGKNSRLPRYPAGILRVISKRKNEKRQRVGHSCTLGAWTDRELLLIMLTENAFVP